MERCFTLQSQSLVTTVQVQIKKTSDQNNTYKIKDSLIKATGNIPLRRTSKFKPAQQRELVGEYQNHRFV
ncbi:hypothetical protein P7K49_017902 [Saguinus oedipus]|uniref:Uncharacterized protein n=1 Tax=Saguinus oedipus TaxID=9490 RepID=A0ABQ9V4K8_SAGOE|nr:hypothetical protein P7K49_017902 [Saguinus oedipus]